MQSNKTHKADKGIKAKPQGGALQTSELKPANVIEIQYAEKADHANQAKIKSSTMAKVKEMPTRGGK